MFAPSHHVTFGAPGTVRRGRTNENAGVHLPTKTPVRAPLGGGGGPMKPGQGTVGRPLGLKTVERNVLAQKDAVDDIGPKRLFQTTSKPAAHKAHAHDKHTLKTPGPARQPLALRTPAPQLLPAPSPLPLPSAQRTRRRSRTSLHLSPDAHTSFVTPAPAHRWDEEVSLDSILEADVEAALQPDSDYELEYVPPRPAQRAFAPLWADGVPNPVESMKAIAGMRPLFARRPPSPPPSPKFEDGGIALTLCADDELEHPLLRKPKAKAKTPAATGAAKRLAPAAGPATTRRPASASASNASAARTASSLSRPAVTSRAPSVSRAAVPSRASSLSLGARPASAVPRAPLSASARPVSTSASSRAPLSASARPAAPTAKVRPVSAPATRAPVACASASRSLAASTHAPRTRPVAPSSTSRLASSRAPIVRSILGPAPAPTPAPLSPRLAAAVADLPELQLDLDFETNVPVLDIPDMPEPELKVAPVPVVEVSEPLPSEASAASVSAAPAPTRPKVTVTAPDTSAEITQDLDVSFLLTLADPPAVDEAPAHDQGMLSVPGEFTAQEPVSPVLDWFDEGSDSFELQDLSDIPDMPSPVPSTGTLPDQLSEQADVDPNAEVGNTTISTTASWSEGDMSFTDDILAAEMARCLDLNGNRGL